MTGYVVAALTAFLLIVPVELPDKTFVATLVLATRYRPWPVWLGVVVAFGVQTAVAVLAGRLITLLPSAPVRLVAAALFAVGSVLLVRSARRASVEEQEFLIEMAPQIYYITDHYKGYPAVLARPAKLTRAEARGRLDKAWRLQAPKSLVKQRDAAK